MKNIFNFENLKKNLINIINRFPVTLIIVVIISVLLFINLHFFYDDSNIIIAILSLIITFFFSIGLYLTTESLGLNKTKKNLLQIIPIIFGIQFFYIFNRDIFDSFENFVYFFLTLVGIISYLFFSAYLKNIFKTKRKVFYIYFYNIASTILISFILSGILFLLGFIGIGAVDTLFSLNISEEKTYGNWAILSLAFITPLFYLTQIPKDFNTNIFHENMFFSFLIKYILTPFITIYFLILYIYSIKVLYNFGEWPKGEVSWMVIGFSVFGYISYIFSYIFEEKNNFIKIFRKIFPYIVIPQIFMLFYAIYLRINQYDITVNRYFIVVFGLWFLVISLYYIFSKKKHLIFIPVVLTIFTIIISIGPWSVYSLPESRQLERLEKNLISANILKDGKITALKNYEEIDNNLSRNIYSGIDYICGFNNCSSIKKLFPLIYKEIKNKDKIEWENYKKEDTQRYAEAIEKYKDTDKKRAKRNERLLEKTLNKKYNGPSRYEIVDKITKTIKVEKYYLNDTKQKEYININNNYEGLFPIITKGYSKIMILQSDKYDSNNKEYAQIDINKETIRIIKNGKTLKEIYIKEILNKLTKKYNTSGSRRYSQKDLTFELKQNNQKYKIIFSAIDIKNPKYKGNAKSGYHSAYGYLLY